MKNTSAKKVFQMNFFPPRTEESAHMSAKYRPTVSKHLLLDQNASDKMFSSKGCFEALPCHQPHQQQMLKLWCLTWSAAPKQANKLSLVTCETSSNNGKLVFKRTELALSKFYSITLQECVASGHVWNFSAITWIPCELFISQSVHKSLSELRSGVRAQLLW